MRWIGMPSNCGEFPVRPHRCRNTHLRGQRLLQTPTSAALEQLKRRGRVKLNPLSSQTNPRHRLLVAEFIEYD